MSWMTCPECRAQLDPEVLAISGTPHCPYCDSVLPEKGEGTDTDDVPEEVGNNAVTLHVSDSPPDDSRIEVHQASDKRLVMLIPPGGRAAAGFGRFVAVWLLFLFVSTPVWMAAGPINWIPLLSLSVLWVVGIGLLSIWIRLKFERTLILVDHERAVVQHVLFRRRRQYETALTPESRATLVEAYSQNDVPVFSVAIPGRDRSIRFGTSLSNQEKDWLVDRINLLIAPKVLSGSNRDGENSLLLRDVASESDLPDPGGPLPEVIHVLDDDSDRLSFWIPAVCYLSIRWVILMVGIVFSTAWYGGLATALMIVWAEPDLIVKVVVAVVFFPFMLAGLMPLIMGLFAWFGRISVSLDRERISVRWHVGPLGLTRTMPVEDISHVGFSSVPSRSGLPRNAQAVKNGELDACVVVSRVSDRYLLLTFLVDDPITTHVAWLVRQRLKSFRERVDGPQVTADA